MKSFHKKAEYHIPVAYLVIGALWIIFSDAAINYLTDDPEVLSSLQTYKGQFFILITAVLLFFLVKREMNRRKEVESQLQEARKAAEQADRVKTQFMSNMSHEIRTPMNAIIGFSELLKGEDIETDRSAEYLKHIQDSGKELVDLLTNISDASMLQVGELEVDKTEFNLNELLEDLFIEASVDIREHSEGRINMDLNLPLKKEDSNIVSDYGKLSRLLYHLVNNAVKYTYKGRIELGYELSGTDKVRFFVKDTGLGIPDSDQKEIFKSFVKSGDERDVSKGAGLGLSIAKGFAEVMGGSIELHSKEGSGTVVMIDLPYVKGSPE